MNYATSEISGILVKIAYQDQVDILLNHGSPNRPAARFNRQGQDALYLSVNEESARIAMLKYVRPSDPPRVLIHYEVQRCEVVDLRHSKSEKLRLQASSDWQVALEHGVDPTSWQASDALRAANEMGIIDPSRRNPVLMACDATTLESIRSSERNDAR